MLYSSIPLYFQLLFHCGAVSSNYVKKLPTFTVFSAITPDKKNLGVRFYYSDNIYWVTTLKKITAKQTRKNKSKQSNLTPQKKQQQRQQRKKLQKYLNLFNRIPALL